MAPDGYLDGLLTSIEITDLWRPDVAEGGEILDVEGERKKE